MDEHHKPDTEENQAKQQETAKSFARELDEMFSTLEQRELIGPNSKLAKQVFDPTVSDLDYFKARMAHHKRCPNDTDGDGDCHLCHGKGGCFHAADHVLVIGARPSDSAMLQMSILKNRDVAEPVIVYPTLEIDEDQFRESFNKALQNLLQGKEVIPMGEGTEKETVTEKPATETTTTETTTTEKPAGGEQEAGK